MNLVEHDPLAMLTLNMGLKELSEHLRQQDGPAALASAERLLAHVEAALAHDVRVKAFVLSNASDAYALVRNFPRARACLAEALEIFEDLFGPTNAQAIIAAGKLARLCDEADCALEASEYHERAMRGVDQGLCDATTEATVLNNYAEHLKARRDWVRAEVMLRRAIELGAAHGRFERLKNLGDVLKELDRYGEAEQAYRAALAGFRETLGPQHVLVGVASAGLASLFIERVRSVPFAEVRERAFEQAEPLLRTALAIFEAKLGANHGSTAIALADLSIVLLQRGRTQEAVRTQQRALATARVAFGPEHPETLKMMSNAGSMLALVGQYDDSVNMLAAVISHLEARNADSRTLAMCLYELASVQREAKLPSDTVLATAARAATVARRALVEGLANLADAPDATRRAVAGMANFAVNFHVSLHANDFVRDPKARDDAFLAVQRFKGTVLEATLGRTQRPEISQQLRVVHEEMVSEYFKSEDAMSSPELARLAETKRRIETEAAASEGPARHGAEIAIDSIRNALSPGGVLIEIAVDIPFKSRGGTGIEDLYDLEKAKYVAYVLRATGEPRLVVLGEIPVIDGAVETARQRLAAKGDATAALHEVYRLLVAPLRELVDGCQTLIVAPEGHISLIPFAALVDDDGKCLGETFAVRYVTCGRDLLRKPTSRAHEPVLVLADPAYGAAGQRNFRRLAGSAREADAVADVWTDARVRTGGDAAKARLLDCHGPLILHVATHGFFRSGTSTRRAPLERDTDMASLLGSGLAFAGANDQPPEHSLLTAMEAAHLDLVGTQLVVLSACETGSATPTIGDEYHSLRRAFLMAGAGALIVTLWDVADVPTALLMGRLHENLHDGMARTAALRDAQRALAGTREFSHPYYWAAFICIGADGPIDVQIEERSAPPARAPVPARAAAPRASFFFGAPATTDLSAEREAEVTELARLIQLEVNGIARFDLKRKMLDLTSFNGEGKIPEALAVDIAEIRSWLGPTQIGTRFGGYTTHLATPRDVGGLGRLVLRALDEADQLPVTYRRAEEIDPATVQADEILCGRCGELSKRFLKFCLYCNALLPHFEEP